MSSKIIQVALWSVDSIGLKSYRKVEAFLQEHSVTWSEWWHSHPGVWWASGLRPHQQAALVEFKTHYTPEAYADYLQSRDIWTWVETDSQYPKLLLPLADRPPVLFGQGKAMIPERAVAIVGTRQITRYGQQVTQQLVKELVKRQVTIISGFMYGVDVVAQKTACDHHGQTVGVLGFGFDYLYPASQRPLFNELLANSQTFITEYAPHVPPNKGTFICRNRIVAGLSQATIVTEAGLKSGSHGTANWAVEYGRSVCAVPGSITNPYSRGTKWLINQGARLVDSAQDIFDELDWEYISHPTSSPVPTQPGGDSYLANTSNTLSSRVLTELASMRQSTEQLALNCRISVPIVLRTLTHLELAERVKKDGPFWTVW